MKKYLQITAIMALAIQLNACVIKPIYETQPMGKTPNAQYENFLNQSSELFKSSIQTSGEALIRAIAEGNQAEAKLLMGESLIERTTPATFLQIQSDLKNNCGELKEIIYLDDFKNTLFRTALYKLSFEKTLNGEIVKMQMPCQVGYGIEKGEPKVMLFNFAPIL